VIEYIYMRKIVIGVMGPGDNATQKNLENAFEIGKLIALEDWITLSGGRKQGVINAASKGAKSVNGLTIAIIPTKDNENTTEFADIAIITEMGSARNNINVLSSNVVVACGMGAGTASEVSLALKARKHVVLLTDNEDADNFFKKLDKERIHIAKSPSEVINILKSLII
jgi:uncharacterized protein (TIGR00725 family)